MDAIGPLVSSVVAQKVGLALLLEPKVFNPACIVVGTLIPCHETIKALEGTRRSQDRRDELLQYWLCFAALSAAESVVGPAITKMRFYPQLKLCLLLWLQLPRTHGAQQLYQQARPHILRHMPKVDRCLEVSYAHLAAAASSFYSAYRVPIDQLALLLQASTGKLKECLLWLTSDDEGQGSAGSSSRQSPEEQPAGASGPRGSSGRPAHPDLATELHSSGANSDTSSSWVDADLGS